MHGSENVSCVVNVAEGEDNVTLLVTKNRGFTKGDEKDIKSFERLIPKTCQANSTDEVAKSCRELWLLMLKRYKRRLRDSYIPELHRRLNAQDQLIAHSELCELSDICNRCQLENSSDKLNELVLKAHAIRNDKSVQEVLGSDQKSTHLWNAICFLGRIRTAYQSLVDIVGLLPTFQRITIICIPRPEKQQLLTSPLRAPSDQGLDCSNSLPPNLPDFQRRHFRIHGPKHLAVHKFCERSTYLARALIKPDTTRVSSLWNPGSTGVSRVCAANQSSTLTFQFKEYPDGSQSGVIAASHVGPCTVYLKAVTSATNLPSLIQHSFDIASLFLLPV